MKITLIVFFWVLTGALAHAAPKSELEMRFTKKVYEKIISGNHEKIWGVFSKEVVNGKLQRVSFQIGEYPEYVAERNQTAERLAGDPIVDEKRQTHAVVMTSEDFAGDGPYDSYYSLVLIDGKKMENISPIAHENIFADDIDLDHLKRLGFALTKEHYRLVHMIDDQTNMVIGFQLVDAFAHLNIPQEPNRPILDRSISVIPGEPIYQYDPAAGRSVLVSGTEPIYQYDPAAGRAVLVGGGAPVYQYNASAGRSVLVGIERR